MKRFVFAFVSLAAPALAVSLMLNVSQWAASELPTVNASHQTLSLGSGWPGSEPRTVSFTCDGAHVGKVAPVEITIEFNGDAPHTAAMLNVDGTWSIDPRSLLHFEVATGFPLHDLRTMVLLAAPILPMASMEHGHFVNSHFCNQDS